MSATQAPTQEVWLRADGMALLLSYSDFTAASSQSGMALIVACILYVHCTIYMDQNMNRARSAIELHI